MIRSGTNFERRRRNDQINRDGWAYSEDTTNQLPGMAACGSTLLSKRLVFATIFLPSIHFIKSGKSILVGEFAQYP
ncbi:hypothetical protein YC2023_010830 [Brassica napus]